MNMYTLYLRNIVAQMLVRRILTSLVHRAAVAQECRLPTISPPQILWHRYYGTPSDTDSTDSKQEGVDVKSTPTSTDNKTGSTLTSVDNKIFGSILPTRCADELSGGNDGNVTRTSIGDVSVPTNTAESTHSTSIIYDADAVDNNDDDDDPDGFSEVAASIFDDNMDDISDMQERQLDVESMDQPRYTSSDTLRNVFDEEDLNLLNAYQKEWDPRDDLDGKKMEASRQSKMSTYLEELETLPILHVLCTFNNTYINICDHTGRILTWKSAGSIGYKNSRRGTSFAAQSVGQAAAQKARDLGIRKVRVQLKGLGIGRQHSLKGFELGGLQIMSIQDVTPIPHNGCRPKKKRRI